MGVGHDWAEEERFDLTWVKGLIKVDTFLIAPDKGMAIYFLSQRSEAVTIASKTKRFFRWLF